MTKLTQTMLRKDQARFLGLIGVTAVIAACLSHMLDINSTDEDVRDASTLRLCQSVQVLQCLRGIYASADAAASFVASLAAQAGVTLPSQPTLSSAESLRTGNNRFASPSTTLDQDSYLEPPDTFSNGQGFVRSPFGYQMGSQPAGWDTSPTPQTSPPRRCRGSTNAASNSGRGHMLSNLTSSEQDTFQIDTTFGGPWNSDSGPASFDWSSNAESGMDLGLMSFNYDFYTDAFGFLDGHNKGFQHYSA